MSMAKAALLKERLEMEKYYTPEGRKKYTIKPFEDKLSFDKGFFVFVRAIQLLTSHNEGTILVGLGGPSGSGKTAFSEKVRSFMPGVCVISMDNYNDGSKVIDSNFDDPRLTDYDLLLQNIRDLKNGKNIQMPIYDFKTSQRIGYKEVEVPESRVVIIEGIYALNEKLRELLDLRVSITGGIHFDLVKRVLRDLNRSGLQADEIIQQVSDTVYPMYKAFIEPDLKTAQLKVYNKFNPFSGFICNPIYILKSKIELPTDTLLTVLDKTAKMTETEIVDIYLLPPNEDPEQCSSWLRMRSRDGRYSLMFEEWMTEVPYIISPRVTFEVSARILGGLMALGYEIGPILKRKSIVHSDGVLSVKQDTIEKLGKFTQIHGNDRAKVREAAMKLGLEGSYIPRSYIEQVQLENLVAALKAADVSEHLGLEREALSRQFYLDRFNSDPELLRPGPKQIFSASQRHLTRSESAPFQASELFPDGRFGGNKTAHIGIGGFSDDGGGTTGSFPPDNHQDDLAASQTSFQHSPRQRDQAFHNFASAQRMNGETIEQRIVDLTKAVTSLANSFSKYNATNREFQFTLLAAGCVFFGAGLLVGYKCAQR